MKRFAALGAFFLLLIASRVQAEVGKREFNCIPMEVYELTFEGLRMAPEEVQQARTIGRDFLFEEKTGWKREISSDRAIQYRILNPDNLIGSPVVAQYGDLNPTFLKFLMSDMNDPTKFIYFQFGGGINVFGKCTTSGW